MKKTTLILAGAAALCLGAVGVAAQAQQQTREPPRLPTSSTGPTFPGPQSSIARPVPACAPGERPPCHGPVTPRIPTGGAAAVAGPPPVDEGPGPYDHYPRESTRAASAGSSPGSNPHPGGCVLRPGVPSTCGDGPGPAAIGENGVYCFQYLPSEKVTLARCEVPDCHLTIRPVCTTPAKFSTSCRDSGGRLSESGGAFECLLSPNGRELFQRFIGASGADQRNR